jgi:F-type H+-transporting ATPase subunit a
MGERTVKRILSLFAALLLSVPALVAQDPQTHGEADGGFDVGKMVVEHLGDSYSWQIVGSHDKGVELNLPIIVRSRGGGWHVFSSARLAGGAEYRGFYIAHEGPHEGKVVERDGAGAEVRPAVDISLTKNALSLIINCGILLLVIMPVARRYRRGSLTPAKGFYGAVEMLLVDVYEEVVKPCVGQDYKRFAPYLLTVFFFIFVNNLMGLIPILPGGTNITGNIAVTLVLALATFLAVNFSGTKEYWKEVLWPEVPLWLKVPLPLMPLVEIAGIFTKPFALMIRLFANIMAGHAIVLGLTSIIFITGAMGVGIQAGMSVVSVLFTIFIGFLELLVAYIQAYVFTMLSAVFIGMARVKHEKHTERKTVKI